MTAQPIPACSIAAYLDHATIELDCPQLALFLPALRSNAALLRRRSNGTMIRIATKSVRSRKVLDFVGAAESVMTYSLDEAQWLVRSGMTDALMGYPTVERNALRAVAGDPQYRNAITLMIDDPVQVDIARQAGCHGMSVCIDVDASLRLGSLHLGTRRSPIRTPAQAAELATYASSAGFEVTGVMFYEAQVAGMPDTVPGIRLVKTLSMGELRRRRSLVVRAVEGAIGKPIGFVNGGGTGSIEATTADEVVTEVTVGSGFYMPALFDGYRNIDASPALMFSLAATRHPSARMTTLHLGGYVASGASGVDRLPTPVHPPNLSLTKVEGAGEVQTPIQGSVNIGSRVWLRHAKAGEICERFTDIIVVDLVDNCPVIVDRWPTYRGEGRAFG